MYFDKNGNIFAAANIQGQGLYLSQDTGQSFTLLSGNIPNITAGINLAFDGQQTFMVNDVIGSGNSCCYISTDGGASFVPWAGSSSGGTDLAFNGPSSVLVYGTSDTTALSTDTGNSFNTVRFGTELPSGSFYFIGSADDGQGFHLHDGNAKLWFYSPNNIGLDCISPLKGWTDFLNSLGDLNLEDYVKEKNVYQGEEARDFALRRRVWNGGNLPRV